MLCLACPTNPEWIPVATANPDLILLDHAHCEKKAAFFALTMINRYPDRTKLVKELIGLAAEEIEHFSLVISELEKRGLTLTRDAGCDYAKMLHEHVSGNEPKRMLDFLITGAFIEARSCERFSLLAKHALTEDMRALYRSLFESEAGHYRLYTDIAREYYPHDHVKQRLQDFSLIEAEIVKGLPNKPTMHG
ncbi:MAG: tRNA-(ms[2]io[6]A)-hydroxylase [Candidatus Kapabacteria bacterium]|nr:tRNA-(ms[2]io[6]A)-hydroxylase [Candidatus Kapabacteria bacterium]